MKAVSLVVAMLIGIAGVLGCAGTSGNVTNGVYTSPQDNFTVSVPNLGPGARVQDESHSDGGMVSFHDDFGSLQRIDYTKIPSDVSDLNIDKMYPGMLHEVTLPRLTSQFPGTKVLHERFVGTGENRAYFFVVRIPEGSTLVNLGSGKPMDSTRGALCFLTGGYMYELTEQVGGLGGLLSSADDEEGERKEESFDGVLKSLEEFRTTIQTK